MEDLRAAGVPVLSLAKAGRWDVLPFLVRLAKLLRQERPSIVHGYLTLPNALAALMQPLHGGTVVWGARASDIDMSRYDWLARLSDRLEQRLARRPKLIVANALSGRRHLLERGFPAESIAVVRNGIDVDRFRPDAEARIRIRTELGIAEDEIAVGRIGRVDPQKDYPTFLRAAALVAAQKPCCRFVCAGYDALGLQRDYERLAIELGLTGRIAWLGQRGDLPAVLNGLDLNVSSSAWGEGTPNVIAEGMACGVPAVATDSGDSGWILGETGEVTAKEDPAALAAAMVRMLERIERGAIDRAAVRSRIVEEMSLERLAERTERVLAAALSGARG
jgi:glycosyltransferase involved in cell wall biosynthesis